MRKKNFTGAALIVPIAFALLLAGCGDEDTSEKPRNVTITQASAATDAPPSADVPSAVTPASVTAEITANVEMNSLSEVKADRLQNYIEADMSKIADFSMFICGSGGFADEIAVFELNDETYSGDLKNALQARVDSRAADFKDYNADEYDKLEHALIKVSGRYVILAVTSDNDKAESIFNGLVG